MTLRSKLVGREHEVAVLRGALTSALDARPRLVICRGEPGIGKTRLAEEIAGIAAGQGVPVAWGHAFDDAPPLWPWRQLLRSVHQGVDLRALADAHHLRRAVGDIAPEIFGVEPEARSVASPAQRFTQFDGVARLLHQVAAETPLVLIIDDVQVSDRASLLLLQHVARTLDDERLLLFVTHRDTEGDHSQLMLDILRGPASAPLNLSGLDVDAVAAQLATIIGRPVSDSQAEEVHALTGGNPFFVRETALILRAEGKGTGTLRVAPGVLQSIAGRLQRLSPPCRRLLTAGSIFGRQFPLVLAAAMLDADPAECWAAVDEATGAGFIDSGAAAGELRFTHALVRDAVEAALPSAERVRLHRRAVRVIEDRYAGSLESHLFELAHHWAVAATGGDERTAAEWIGRAAEFASRQFAFEQSADLFRLALRVGGTALSETEQCQALLGAGAALHGAADLSGRLDACVRAAELARRLERPDLLAEAALILEGAIEQLPTNVTARRLCEEALATLPGDAPALRSRVMARLAQVCVYLGDLDAAGPLSQQALDLAERSCDPAAIDAALHGRQLARDGPDGLAERECLAARLLRLARETHAASRELWGRLWLVDACFERGDLAGAARELQLLRPLADEVGGPWPRWHVLRGLAVLAQAQARFTDARRLAADALQVITRTHEPTAAIPCAAILQAVGHHTGQDAASLAASGIGEAPIDGLRFLAVGATPLLATAQLLLEAGRAAEAGELYRTLGTPESWRPHAHGTLAALTMGVHIAAALNADEDVSALVRLLEPFRGLHVASGAGPVAYGGPVELHLGIAARHLGQPDQAITDLQHAVRACAVSGAEGFRVEAQVELAEELATRGGRGDRDRSHTLAAEAVRQATGLGMAPFAVRARDLLQELEAGHPAASLTRREREVAELMGRGLTNNQIAAQLFLSPRTAANHVQHVLAKLELDNRAQVAAWVTAQKLRIPAE